MPSPNWQFHCEVIARALDILEETGMNIGELSDAFLKDEFPIAMSEARQSLAYLVVYCSLTQRRPPS